MAGGVTNINWLGIAFSVNALITSFNVGFTAWLSTRWIETNSTQESILERVSTNHEDVRDFKLSIERLQSEVVDIPRNVDDSDRWHKNEELQYQKYIDVRIRRLEMFHPPDNGKYE